MKTKHLFLATALVASLAACTNEEIVSDVQQNVATGRPTVDNVMLNFGMGADSRVVYDGGWAWNSTDVIGALLMDDVKDSWNHDMEAAWGDKYELTHHIHTSYPFTYTDGAWSCNTKMLEGNYFFAHPWASYDGIRQVRHSLLAQKQAGITKDVRGKSYAENNLFIGYQRIVAGTQAQDVLEDVKMYPVLGAIQLQIKNTGTQDRHINKVVLSGTGLYSTLTFNPTEALDPRDEDNKGFLSAEYLNISEELADDFKPWTKAEKEDHILSVVGKGITEDEQNEGFVQVTIEGTKAERLLKAGAKNTAYVMVMANPVDVEDGELILSIYTDEGVVANIDLTAVNDEIDVDNNGKGTTAITSAVVDKIGPNTTNTIEVQIDDNSFTVPRTLDIYTTEDLLQLIKWNANAVGKRTVTAALKKNVTLTEEVAEILATAKLITLNVTGAEGTELTIAEEVPATFFDEILNKNDDRTNAALTIAEEVEVIIEGTINVGENTIFLPANLKVAEEGTLNINVDFKKNYTTNIVNEGTLKIADEISVKSATITNLGSMVVGEEADVKATVINGDGDVEAELKNNGYMTDVTNNAKAVVKLGKGASLVDGSNAGLIITAKDAIVDAAVSNTGKIEFVTGAIVNAGGTVYEKITASVTLEADEDDESPVNALLIEGATVTIKDDVADFTTIILGENAKLTVNKGKTLTLSTLETIEVEEEDGFKAYTQGEGTINVNDVNVYEFTTLVNTGNIHVNTSFDNDGTVNNKGAVEVPASIEDALNNSDWNYNEADGWTAATVDNATVIAKRAAYNEALRGAINVWVADISHNNNPDAAWSGLMIKTANFNLRQAEVKEGNDVITPSALSVFTKWMNAYETSGNYYGNATVKNAFDKYEEYVTAYTTVHGATKAEALKITDEYTLAVDTLLAEYQGNEYDHDNLVMKYTEANDKLKAVKAAMTWVPATLVEGFSRIYHDTKDAKNNTITAETQALEAFQEALLGDELGLTSNFVNQTTKVMLITLGGNYAPACSQVFETSNVYKTLQYVKTLADWTGIDGFDGWTSTYTTEASLNWNNEAVIKFVNQAMKYDFDKATTKSPEAKAAHDFVIDNSFEVYYESKDWNYNVNIINAIMGELNGFTVVSNNVVVPNP